MNDFLGNTLAIDDTVVWRGRLTGSPQLVKGKVVRFSPQRVWIEVPHWWMRDKTLLTCVHPNLLVKVL